MSDSFAKDAHGNSSIIHSIDCNVAVINNECDDFKYEDDIQLKEGQIQTHKVEINCENEINGKSIDATGDICFSVRVDLSYI